MAKFTQKEQGPRKIRLVLSFVGSSYAGWQRQKNALAIQEVVENCLSKLCQEQISLLGCSRTDAGVHALRHVSHFSTSSKIPASKLPLALNALLPSDIVCLEASEASEDFHARFKAKGKRYSYTFGLNKYRSPFFSAYQHHLPYFAKLILPKLKESREILRELDASFSFLLGEHDFAAFEASGAQSLTTWRTMTYFGLEFFDEENKSLLRLTWQNDLTKLGLAEESLPQEELIKLGLTSQVYEKLTRASKMVFIVEGNAFLYNMVRIFAVPFFIFCLVKLMQVV